MLKSWNKTIPLLSSSHRCSCLFTKNTATTPCDTNYRMSDKTNIVFISTLFARSRETREKTKVLLAFAIWLCQTVRKTPVLIFYSNLLFLFLILYSSRQKFRSLRCFVAHPLCLSKRAYSRRRKFCPKFERKSLSHKIRNFSVGLSLRNPILRRLYWPWQRKSKLPVPNLRILHMRALHSFIHLLFRFSPRFSAFLSSLEHIPNKIVCLLVCNEMRLLCGHASNNRMRKHKNLLPKSNNWNTSKTM